MFQGTHVSEYISKKLHTVVWTKTPVDPQYLNNPIDDKHLEALAEMVAVSEPQSLSTRKSAARLAVHKMRQAFEKIGGPKERENVAQIKAAVDRVVESLDSLKDVPIDRLYLVSASPRRDALRDSDVDLVVFLKNLSNEKSAKFLLEENFRKIAGEVATGETSFFFSVGAVDVCVSYTLSIHAQPALQRGAVIGNLSSLVPISEHDKCLYSTACAESLPEFYQRFLKSSEMEFYLNVARLVRLWKSRNIPDVAMNSLVLVFLGLRIAEHHVSVSGDQSPSATAVMLELMQTLNFPEKISVFFDTFSTMQTPHLAESLDPRPSVLEPANFFNNLAETVSDWAAVKEAAVVSLENMKSRRALSSLFPAVARPAPSSPTIVRAAKGA